MRKIDNKILFSATDLMRFMGCTHATALDLMRLKGEGPTPGEDTEDAALLQKQGDAHELAHLERLKAAGNRVVEIEGETSPRIPKRHARHCKAVPRSSSKVHFCLGTGVDGRIFSSGWTRLQHLDHSVTKWPTPN